MKFLATSNKKANDVVARYNLYLKSSNAETQSTQTGSCKYRLKENIILSQPGTAFEITVPRLSVPFVFYQFNDVDGTNRFSYNVSTNATPGTGFTGTLYTCTIPNGNYTLSDLATQLKSSLLTQLVANGFATNTYPIVINYLSYNNHVQIYITSGGANLQVRPRSSPVATAFGFTSGTTYFNNLGTTAESEVACNTNPSEFLYITSPTFVQSSCYGALNGAIGLSNIICAIPIQECPFSYIAREIQVPEKVRIDNDIINEIELNLVNAVGAPLQYMNLPWTIHLQIEEIILTDDEFVNQPEIASYKNQLLTLHSQANLQEGDLLNSLQDDKHKLLSNLEELRRKIRKVDGFSKSV